MITEFVKGVTPTSRRSRVWRKLQARFCKGAVGRLRGCLRNQQWTPSTCPEVFMNKTSAARSL